MLRVVLVDDEPLSLRGLERLLQREADVEIVGTAMSGDTALRAIRALKPDIVFLDVQMPGLSGIEVASALRDEGAPEIIFVTAFDQYAVEAFGVEAVDYVLKPLQADRVRQSLQRAKRRSLMLSAPYSTTQPSVGPVLHLPDRYGGIHIYQSEIIWIEAEKDYALVHTESRSLMLRTTMSDLARSLSPPLMRVHRSAFVSLNRVHRTVASGKGVFSLVLNDGTTVQVGPSYACSIRLAIRRLNVKQALYTNCSDRTA